MTTKEYVKKYNLDKGTKFSHNAFVQDMHQELLALCEMNKAIDNLKGFDNALRCIKMKWDAIVNKTLGVFPEKLWGYFFATVVVPLKQQLCSREVAVKEQIRANKRAAWEERKKWHDSAFGFDGFWERMWSAALLQQIRQTPAAEFIVLGIKNIEGISIDDVRMKYRSLVQIHHPDKGGKREDFIKITEAKNKCITWLISKNVA